MAALIALLAAAIAGTLEGDALRVHYAESDAHDAHTALLTAESVWPRLVAHHRRRLHEQIHLVLADDWEIDWRHDRVFVDREAVGDAVVMARHLDALIRAKAAPSWTEAVLPVRVGVDGWSDSARGAGLLAPLPRPIAPTTFQLAEPAKRSVSARGASGWLPLRVAPSLIAELDGDGTGGVASLLVVGLDDARDRGGVESQLRLGESAGLALVAGWTSSRWTLAGRFAMDQHKVRLTLASGLLGRRVDRSIAVDARVGRSFGPLGVEMHLSGATLGVAASGGRLVTAHQRVAASLVGRLSIEHLEVFGSFGGARSALPAGDWDDGEELGGRARLDGVAFGRIRASPSWSPVAALMVGIQSANVHYLDELRPEAVGEQLLVGYVPGAVSGETVAALRAGLLTPWVHTGPIVTRVGVDIGAGNAWSYTDEGARERVGEAPQATGRVLLLDGSAQVTLCSSRAKRLPPLMVRVARPVYGLARGEDPLAGKGVMWAWTDMGTGERAPSEPGLRWLVGVGSPLGPSRR